MSLLDEIAAEVRGPGSRCSVGVLLEENPAGAAELQAALDSDYPATAISAALKKRGHTISDTTISRHRRGACQCS